MKLKTSHLISGFQDNIFEIPVNQLADRGTVFTRQTIKCKLTSEMINNKINLTGEIKATPEYQCVRCLEKNPKSIVLPLNLSFCFAGKNNIKENELNTIYIKKENDSIDLNTIIADIISLAEPIKPLCRQNCEGLCQKCGINKKYTCSCKIENRNTNWEALKIFQNKYTLGE